jgi:hypothetical protein
MSSPLTAKRRKLNEASTTLARPFVSPLKTAKSDPTTLSRHHNGTTSTPYRPSTLTHTVAASPTTTPSSSSKYKPPGAIATKSTPVRISIGRLTNRTTKDPAEIATQKSITSLELQIRAVRNEIDTLSQAQRLSASSRDAELEELAAKWKAAAQCVAEEVFGTVKERVCRMGGVQAWRESEKRKFDRVHGLGEFAEKDASAQEDDEEDCEFDSQGEELPEEEAEWRKSEKKRIRKEREDAMDDEGVEADAGESGEKRELVWQEPGQDDDVSVQCYRSVNMALTLLQEFTIDMMLRSLNIDLDVIGYDKVAQKWVLRDLVQEPK